MNNEQLEKGKKLSEWITELEQEEKLWENSQSLRYMALNTKKHSEGSISDYQIKVHFVNFEVIKTLALSEVRKKLKVVREEYAQL